MTTLLRHDYVDIRTVTERSPTDVDGVLPEGAALDFGEPFMPEALATSEGLGLNVRDTLRLNQIRGYGYVRMLAFAECFIVPFLIDVARSRLRHDDERLRALLSLASLEAKHLALFRRFSDAFERGFGSPCGVAAREDAMARDVLRRAPLTIALVALHIEAATGPHLRAAEQATVLEPNFAGLFHSHHEEASQHVRVLENLVLELCSQATATDRRAAVEGYLDMIAHFERALTRQADLDVASLRRASGEPLPPARERKLRQHLRRDLHRSMLGMSMSEPTFLAALDSLGGDARVRVEAASARFR